MPQAREILANANRNRLVLNRKRRSPPGIFVAYFKNRYQSPANVFDEVCKGLGTAPAQRWRVSKQDKRQMNEESVMQPDSKRNRGIPERG